MFFFYFLAALLLPVRLRRLVERTNMSPKWRQPLLYMTLGIVGLFILTQKALDDYEIINAVIGILALSGVVLYLQLQPEFVKFQFYFNSHYPLITVGLVSSVIDWLAPAFYEKWDYIFVCGELMAFSWIFIRWAANKKQREELQVANLRNAELDRLVELRTAELTQQKAELEKTIDLLKATQAQLIQQEKLASLGELTAGIAHEIQNPLNFVNNFSEVSIELMDEMAEELAKGDTEEVMAIAGDIKQNLEKIIHHGKRADGIVKGMLQHSRASSDTKEPTDINKLADEYFRLAYHGLRAKDKSFNAELVTSYTDGLPAITLVPQDVGRVLLNMFTNAFYAVHQKQKKLGVDFKPVVSVTTSALNKAIEIRVKDNGTGIPDDIRDKILQPFFTTKPTGEGTGLGLSISYDIITKAHGGKIDINSTEGEGSEFIITLPTA
ncbi:sensor histidine kinase [Mucilaginibacter myungsuensis]|uniref:histidine kinase n=1 Tax=Mucilaginibacter myungsuensis TaxID=649104 RepID=A0A929KXC0_9SPHI|nr:ATP-binding protein [Mucilaginibacter myungsuensis]MBE9660629.1 histidine kinase [Mucilaginibacter myungsuensis]MDN3600674.1 ATP-binding protein [Mucilaginibacter myungsuensis]